MIDSPKSDPLEETDSRKGEDHSFRFWESRITDRSNRLLLLLVALILFIVAFPLVNEPLLLGIFLNVIIVAAISTIFVGKRARGIAIVFAIAPLVAFAFHSAGSERAGQIGLILGSIFFGFVALALLKHIIHTDNVEAEIIYGAVSCYLIIGLAWTMIVQTLFEFHPESFTYTGQDPATFFDFLYYSFVSLTTFGYGDLTPLGDFAKALAIVEAVIGVFYMGIIISRLVSLYGRQSTTRS